MDAQAKDIKHYLNNMRFRPDNIRHLMLKFLIPFTILFQLPIAIADPFDNLFTYLQLLLIAFLILFAIWVAIDPYKRQLALSLHVGIVGTGVSFGFFLGTQKMAYGILHADTPWFLVLTAIGYGSWLFYLIRWHIRRLHAGLYRHSAPQKKTPEYAHRTKLLATGLGGFGVAIGILMKFGNMEIRTVLFSMAVFALALLFGFFVILFHQYRLVRQHPEWVQQIEPPLQKTNRKRKEA